MKTNFGLSARLIKMTSIALMAAAFTLNASADTLVRQPNAKQYIKSTTQNGLIKFSICSEISGSDCVALGNPNGYSPNVLKKAIFKARMGEGLGVGTAIFVDAAFGTLAVVATPLAIACGPFCVAGGVAFGAEGAVIAGALTVSTVHGVKSTNRDIAILRAALQQGDHVMLVKDLVAYQNDLLIDLGEIKPPPAE